MLRSLHGLSDLRLRAAAIRERLDSGALDELDQIVRRAALGSGPDRDLVIALIFARVRGELPVGSLADDARGRGLLAAESVLRHDGPHRAVRGRLPEPLIAAGSVARLRQAPPDYTRAAFRIASAPVRERLLRDPRASVVRGLLDLPSTTLGDVLRLASRRPSTPELSRAIAASRWLTELPVREALVRNPFVETWFALALLPTVRRAVLAGAPLAPELYQMARALCS